MPKHYFNIDPHRILWSFSSTMGLFSGKDKKDKTGWLPNLITRAEIKEVSTRIPPLNGKCVFHIANPSGTYNQIFKEKGAEKILNLDIDSKMSVAGKEEPLSLTMPISRERFPVGTSTCDFAICSVATLAGGGFNATINELARVLKTGGMAALVDLHPFSTFGRQYRSNDPVIETDRPGFEQYFKMLRSNSLVIGNIREIFIDNTIEEYFVGGKKEFEKIHGTPLLLIFFLSKSSARGTNGH